MVCWLVRKQISEKSFSIFLLSSLSLSHLTFLSILVVTPISLLYLPLLYLIIHESRFFIFINFMSWESLSVVYNFKISIAFLICQGNKKREREPVKLADPASENSENLLLFGQRKIQLCAKSKIDFFVAIDFPLVLLSRG
jgi:hypothetical protein